MIKLQDLTPEVYYQQSRDFQYIGRLYDLVLNSIKTNVDMIYSVPSADAAGSKMIDLLALTLGFKAKHEYNVKQLAAICSIFPLILRNKGNIQSILLIGQALLNSEGLTDTFGYTINEDNPYLILLFVPPGLSDINLLLDLLPYVLPAGMVANIVRAVSNERVAETEVAPAHDVHVYYPSKDGDTYSPAEASKVFAPFGTLEETDKHTAGVMTNATVYMANTATTLDTRTDRLYINIGNTISIAEAYPDINYISADPTIASIDTNGLVTGLRTGTTTIGVNSEIIVKVTGPDNQEEAQGE